MYVYAHRHRYVCVCMCIDIYIYIGIERIAHKNVEKRTGNMQQILYKKLSNKKDTIYIYTMYTYIYIHRYMEICIEICIMYITKKPKRS